VPEPEAARSRADQRRRTEARILAEASRLFVERGYERTTIRAIAGAAGVDAGLVMHYFGAKEELFQRVTHARPLAELSGTAEQVTEQVLARLAESLASEPVHSLALLRSMLTHPEAAEALREGLGRAQTQISRPIPPMTRICGPRWSAPCGSAWLSHGTCLTLMPSPPRARSRSSTCCGRACAP
jgi:AcrR family transcriptional regulator